LVRAGFVCDSGEASPQLGQDRMKRVRVAILGTGWGRMGHLPGFQHVEEAEVVAVFSQPLADAQAAADAFQVPAAFDDWSRLLAEARPNLVTVALPPFLHRPAVLDAVQAGCHVLCDKPMALDATQAAEMLQAAEAAGVIHMVDHQLRFHPSLQHVKRLLEDGYVGQPRHVRYHNLNANRGDPALPWHWLDDRQAGGGTLLGGASHHVDLMRWLFGEVQAVSGQLATHIGERLDRSSDLYRPVTSDDQYSLICEFEKGVMAWLFATSVARHPSGLRLEIYGSEGTLFFTEADGLWGGQAGHAMSDLTVPDPNAALPGVHAYVWTTAFVALARELVGAIAQGRALSAGATFHDGLRTQQVLDAARQSWRERRWIKVNSHADLHHH
jgi:predicted dehydrogenase